MPFPIMPKKNNPMLIITYVIPGNVYPVTEVPESEQSLCGCPLMAGYSSHYILTDLEGYPHSKDQKIMPDVYDELVVAQEAQIIPAFLLKLDREKSDASYSEFKENQKQLSERKYTLNKQREFKSTEGGTSPEDKGKERKTNIKQQRDMTLSNKSNNGGKSSPEDKGKEKLELPSNEVPYTLFTEPSYVENETEVQTSKSSRKSKRLSEEVQISKSSRKSKHLSEEIELPILGISSGKEEKSQDLDDDEESL